MYAECSKGTCQQEEKRERRMCFIYTIIIDEIMTLWYLVLKYWDTSL
jgi:hypothetical protein